MTESLEQKMARIQARLERERICPVCEAREERSAIMEHDGNVPRETADRLAREAHPCKHC